MTPNVFLNELKKIIISSPKPPLIMVNSDACEFGNYVSNSKKLFYCFDCASCTDSFYIFDSYMCANCGDCDYAVESQLCYESVDPFKCFNCDFIEYCDNVRDSAYCYKCSNSQNLFGCVNLKNKNFCIFNRQLTEEQYHEQVKRYKSLPPGQILKTVEDLKKRFPLTQTIGSDNENTDYGNYIHNNKNCYLCFDAAFDENCGYIYDSFYNKNSYDMTYASQKNELAYEIVDSGNMFNCNFAINSENCLDSKYIVDCRNVRDCIGCVGLRNKQYCILNRQLTKEDYEIVSQQILLQLKQENIGWGDLQY